MSKPGSQEFVGRHAKIDFTHVESLVNEISGSNLTGIISDLNRFMMSAILISKNSSPSELNI